MKNIEGLYTAITAIINQREEDNCLAIDTDSVISEVREEIDVYSASLDWYIRNTLRDAVQVSLYQKGYRSVVKGEGIFVNLKNCEKPEYLSRLFNNAKLSEAQKTKVVGIIKKTIKEQGCEGQLTFDLEDGTIIEDVTEQQLIEMLRKDANVGGSK